ncbi:TIR domain-containing protein [Flavobacterium arcticum]|uniref:TIR domain-containing protein n=1 Tax=Flavobacterium arcticum TaxID=1784713 RepID=UPI0013C2FA25|nr:TIR domain-containing protein [Flavobacterium arcticum]KAF2511670.1 TIR domain-containing protein [Flavobacterium arcticum]
MIEGNKLKVFISYTVRDGEIDSHFLTKLNHQISEISTVYIDLIHNNSVNKQNRVVNELKKSDFIFLIRTEQTNNSKWVNKELSLARELNIPIVEFKHKELIKVGFQPIIKAIKHLNIKNNQRCS